jgi:hypothetical protein
MYTYANIIDGKVAQIIEDELPFDELGRLKYAIAKDHISSTSGTYRSTTTSDRMDWTSTASSSPLNLRTPDRQG